MEKNELTLTSDEETELIRLETIIENGRRSFIEVGTALMKIWESRLYRKNYKTFEEYCKGKWQYARRTAYQFIDSVKVIENVRHGAQTEILPTNERQTRALSKVLPGQQIEVWQKAVETAPEGKVTARHVQNTVNKMVESKGGKLPQKSAKPSIRKESKNLSQLKFYWGKASSADRKKFRRWLRTQRD